MLANGKNAIAALLAPGWYSTPLEWFQQPNNYGDTPPALRAQLRIEHTDGSVEWVDDGPELAGRPLATFSTPKSTMAKLRMRGSRSQAGIRRVCSEEMEERDRDH